MKESYVPFLSERQMRMPRLSPIAGDRDEAERTAVAALAFLAGRPDDLGRFLSLSGIEPAAIRKSAGEPGFLSGVIDFLLGDETLLLAFAAEAGVRPERVAGLRPALDGALPRSGRR
jgi:hypothetical protein